MANSIFIAATGQHCGKTITSLSLLFLAQKKFRRIGFIKPFGAKPVRVGNRWVDKDAALMAEVFGLGKQLPWMSPVVVQPETTHRVIDGEIPLGALQDKIQACYARLAGCCDFIVIEGSGHPGVGSVMNLSNARIAALLDAPVMIVTGGGLGKVIDDVHLSLALFRQEQAQVRALLVNKIVKEKRQRTMNYLQRALAEQPFPVLGGFDWEPVLSNPTLRRLATLLDLPLRGNRRDAARIVHHVQVGAATPQRVIELLQQSTLLIVSSNRDELLLTLAHLYQMPNYRPLIAGVIIAGLLPVNMVTQRVLDLSRMPYLRTRQHTSGEVLRMIHDDVAKITAKDTEKLALVRQLAETTLDFAAIENLCTSGPKPFLDRGQRKSGGKGAHRIPVLPR